MNRDRLGLSLRALRRRRDWTQDRLAQASKVPRCKISALETGKAATLRIADLDQVAAALGARVDLAVRWKGDALDRLLDEDHASLVDESVALLTRLGWEVAPETSFSIWGERGSIDVLAFHRATAIALVVEVKSVFPDLQATLSALDRKARLAATVAATRGWRATNVGKLLVVADTRTSHRRVARHETTLGVALPRRGNSLRGWLANPQPTAAGGLMYMPVVSARDRRRRPHVAQATTLPRPRSPARRAGV